MLRLRLVLHALMRRLGRPRPRMRPRRVRPCHRRRRRSSSRSPPALPLQQLLALLRAMCPTLRPHPRRKRRPMRLRRARGRPLLRRLRRSSSRAQPGMPRWRLVLQHAMRRLALRHPRPSRPLMRLHRARQRRRCRRCRRSSSRPWLAVSQMLPLPRRASGTRLLLSLRRSRRCSPRPQRLLWLHPSLRKTRRVPPQRRRRRRSPPLSAPPMRCRRRSSSNALRRMPRRLLRRLRWSARRPRRELWRRQGPHLRRPLRTRRLL